MTNIKVTPSINIDFFLLAKITTKNKKIIGLTSLESALTQNGITYSPGLDFTSFANTTLNESDSGNYPLTILTNQDISEFFGATIELSFGSQNNYANIYSFFLGNIKTATFTPQNITLNLVSIAYNLKRGVGDYFSANCRAELGDSKCQVDLKPFTFSGQITSANSRLLSGNHPIKPVGYFINGVILFANGLSYRILDDSRGLLIASNPYKPINIGDNYTITAGCNKSLTMCLNNFNNVVNFRGEPFVNC